MTLKIHLQTIEIALGMDVLEQVVAAVTILAIVDGLTKDSLYSCGTHLGIHVLPNVGILHDETTSQHIPAAIA